VVASFLQAMVREPQTLVLKGEAGVGRTMVLMSGVGLARQRAASWSVVGRPRSRGWRLRLTRTAGGGAAGHAPAAAVSLSVSRTSSTAGLKFTV
jgi:hypothetical protein